MPATAKEIRAETLADLIDRWHASDPGARGRLARALHRVGPVLDRRAVYSGAYRDGGNFRVAWDAGRAREEFPDRIPSGKKLSRLWGIPRACDVIAPEEAGP